LRLFEAVVTLLRVVAQDQGLLLVVEDVHWADSATRELLDHPTSTST
jgi:predicted ATPase